MQEALMEELTTIRKRSQIPQEDTWAIEDLYQNDEAWEQDLKQLEEAGKKLASFDGKLSQARELYNYLSEMERTDVLAERLAHYCMRKADEDTREGKNQAIPHASKNILCQNHGCIILQCLTELGEIIFRNVCVLPFSYLLAGHQVRCRYRQCTVNLVDTAALVERNQLAVYA